MEVDVEEVEVDGNKPSPPGEPVALVFEIEVEAKR